MPDPATPDCARSSTKVWTASDLCCFLGSAWLLTCCSRRLGSVAQMIGHFAASEPRASIELPRRASWSSLAPPSSQQRSTSVAMARNSHYRHRERDDDPEWSICPRSSVRRTPPCGPTERRHGPIKRRREHRLRRSGGPRGVRTRTRRLSSQPAVNRCCRGVRQARPRLRISPPARRRDSVTNRPRARTLGDPFASHRSRGTANAF